MVFEREITSETSDVQRLTGSSETSDVQRLTGFKMSDVQRLEVTSGSNVIKIASPPAGGSQ